MEKVAAVSELSERACQGTAGDGKQTINKQVTGLQQQLQDYEQELARVDQTLSAVHQK